MKEPRILKGLALRCIKLLLTSIILGTAPITVTVTGAYPFSDNFEAGLNI